MIEDSFSNSIHMDSKSARDARRDLVTGMELLMRLYVEPPAGEAGAKHTGRSAIAGAMPGRSLNGRACGDLTRKELPPLSIHCRATR